MLVEDGLLADTWLAEHANGLDDVVADLRGVDIAAACAKAGVLEHDVRRAARVVGEATGGVSIFEDLGIQQAPHSTLNSYLEKLVVLLTGNFGVPGGMNLHSRFASLAPGGGRPEGGGEPMTPTGSHRLVTGLVPCNVIPDEILSDHPDRFRAMLVESANPVHSLADSVRMREALRALDLVVVIDVALTETAREADYVLPAASQLEKWECTFFNLEFPHNVFHLRRPVFEPLAGTLPESEIHARLCRALGAYTDDDVAPLAAAAAEGRRAYFDAFLGVGAARPDLAKLLPVLLYETLGPTLTTPDGVDAAGAAAIWGLAHRCALAYPDSIRRAGIDGDGIELGEALFDAILANPSGITFTVDEYDETMRRVETPDGRVSLAIPMLLDELGALADEPAPMDAGGEYPFVLSAGERRSSTANTIYRDPAWRKKDPLGALRIAPADADSLGLVDGDRARVRTRRGAAVAVVEVTDTMSAGPRVAAQRVRPRLVRRCGRHRAERAHLVRRSRPLRRHAAPQARAGHRRARRRCGLMRRTRFDDWPCPIARTTDLIGDWWTPLILREAFSGRRRFEELSESLGVPRAVLTARLKRLCADGLLVAVPYRTTLCATSTA